MHIEVWERVSYRKKCECGHGLVQRRGSFHRGRFYEWNKALAVVKDKRRRLAVRHFYQRSFPVGWVVQLLVGYTVAELRGKNC